MDELDYRRDSAAQALLTLEEVLRETPSVLVRDAGIKRFEYTFEAVWKLLQAYLHEKEGTSCNSPKSCFREALRVGLLEVEETERCLKMTDDRNRTTHTYQVSVAQDVFGRVSLYQEVMRRLTERIAVRLERP